MNRYYVTTPIYYVNDTPHLGHLYTTVAADVLARHMRMCGRDTFFLTGVDEHGLKVQQAAEARGVAPIALADEVVARYRDLWPRFAISNDDFIRTSSERHKAAVAAMWRRLAERGALYKGMYEDWYCVPCETYWTETQLMEHGDDGRCPDCNRPVERVREESWFFRLSDYQQRLLDHYDSHPDFIAPEVRRNEVRSFVAGGLNDLSVSRTTFDWGVPVPDDAGHVVYVWIDALTNYLSALGFPDEQSERMRFWPASVHLIGKDILRFHAVYWPAMLMAAELPLPERIFAHGWWTVDGEKMSKSKGNALAPEKMLDRADADVLRYFLLREVPFGQDGDFSFAALTRRYNSELANDLGNMLNRSLSMLHKYRGGVMPEVRREEEADRAWIADIEGMQREVDELMVRQAFHLALERIHQVVRHGNRYVEENAPWTLARSGDDARLDCVLYHLIEGLRLVVLQLSPFMPGKCAEMMRQIMGDGAPLPPMTLAEQGGWGLLSPGHTCARPRPVFPRME
ncbi:MAG: methionine--tRNA ligase [Zetaproteobacteria bacterium]|nr:MAG: methionine--tRNA ligase [Zetaproteobacteria bacterium]